MLHLSDKLKDRCKSATIFLDTNVFILASRRTELLELLAELQIHGAAFVTTSSVVFEYTRGSRSIGELKSRREFIAGIVSRIMSIGSLFEHEKNDVFSAVMSLLVRSGDSQYTDFLLAVALYQYRLLPEPAYVLTSDVKAFPLSIFNIEGVITVDNEKEVANEYLISLNKEHYVTVAKKVEV